MTGHTPSERLATMIHNAALPAYIKRELAEILADVRKAEAAAPEMLEALRKTAAMLQEASLRTGLPDYLREAWEDIDAAIAKAEGRAR